MVDEITGWLSMHRLNSQSASPKQAQFLSSAICVVYGHWVLHNWLLWACRGISGQLGFHHTVIWTGVDNPNQYSGMMPTHLYNLQEWTGTANRADYCTFGQVWQGQLQLSSREHVEMQQILNKLFHHFGILCIAIFLELPQFPNETTQK